MALRNTALCFSDVKQTALYFDRLVSINIAGLHFDSHGRYNPNAAVPPGLGDLLCPEELLRRREFRDRNVEIANMAIDNAQRRGDYPTIDTLISGLSEPLTMQRMRSFIDDYGLSQLPVDVPGIVLEGSQQSDDVVMSISEMKLIDTDKVSWDQIIAFRGDKRAQNQLRRLRTFALANYSEKSKSFIEDDLLRRMDDYQRVVKGWGFETITGALNMALNSKSLAATSSGALISVLAGMPVTAAIAAIGGGVVELGKIGLHLARRRFELRQVLAENPLSYFKAAKTKFSR